MGGYMSSTGKTLSRQSGPLIDDHAYRWFVKVVEIMERRVEEYIDVHGDPEDWGELRMTKKGSLGLEISVNVDRKKN